MRRRSSLRWSLLAAAGIIPVACGGERLGGSAGGAGAPGDAGAPNNASGSAGKTSAAGSGDSIAGSESDAGAGGTGGSPALPRHSCSDPFLDPVSGLVVCAEGYEHRPSARACDLAQGGAGSNEVNEGGTGQLPRVDGNVSCFHNEDACQAFELGYCDEDTGGGGNPAVCKSGCVTDEDCGQGYICICDGPSPTGGKCQASDCQTDADCGPGYLCASYEGACGSYRFACQRAADECTKDADCEGSCGFNGSHRVCDGGGCSIGRPFLVESEARVAPTRPSREWSGDATRQPCLDLEPAERRREAELWTRLGQMEHASIAAFARFNLQLLALGAPAELIEECTRALADETAHARICFELASAYAGEPVGPGPLDIDGSLTVTSLVEVVDLVLVEGCLGETRAAAEALEAADAATDPVIRAVHAQIAVDEERHAALAFRFVRWALTRSPQAVSERVALAVRSAATDRATREVVLPCLNALLTRPAMAA